MSIAIESRVHYSSHDMEVTGYDAMDHRTVLSEHHCGSHVHCNISMAEVVGVLSGSLPELALR